MTTETKAIRDAAVGKHPDPRGQSYTICKHKICPLKELQEHTRDRIAEIRKSLDSIAFAAPELHHIHLQHIKEMVQELENEWVVRGFEI